MEKEKVRRLFSRVAEITSLHKQIIASLRRSMQDAIRIGELLTEIKAELKHGEWLPWIKQSLPFSQQTANRYMRIYENREKLLNVSNLTEAYKFLAEPEQSDRENNGSSVSAKKSAQKTLPIQNVKKDFRKVLQCLTKVADGEMEATQHDAMILISYGPVLISQIMRLMHENNWTTSNGDRRYDPEYRELQGNLLGWWEFADRKPGKQTERKQAKALPRVTAPAFLIRGKYPFKERRALRTYP